jgi:hypothetical protein
MGDRSCAWVVVAFRGRLLRVGQSGGIDVSSLRGIEPGGRTVKTVRPLVRLRASRSARLPTVLWPGRALPRSARVSDLRRRLIRQDGTSYHAGELIPELLLPRPPTERADLLSVLPW